MGRLFTSRHIFKVDKKGRVSVPASFRAVIQGESGGPYIYLRESQGEPAIEGLTPTYLEELAASIEHLDHNTDERDNAEFDVFTSIHEVRFDDDGRMILPAALRDFAGITDTAEFAGMGRRFMIWNPDALKRHTEERRKAGKRVTLKALPRRGEPA